MATKLVVYRISVLGITFGATSWSHLDGHEPHLLFAADVYFPTPRCKVTPCSQK